MINLDAFELFYYFTDSTLYGKSNAALLLYANQLELDEENMALLFIAKNRRTLRIIFKTPAAIISLKKRSLKHYFPTTTRPTVLLLKKADFLAVFEGKYYRKV